MDHCTGESERANQSGRSDETAYAVSTAKMSCRRSNSKSKRCKDALQKYCKDVLQKVELELEEMHMIAIFCEQFTFRVTNGRRDETTYAC